MQYWVSYKSFHLYDVEFGLCLSVRDVVSHLSRCELTLWWSTLWFEQWLEWWRWLIPSWHVVVEFAKDRFLGVGTPRQHMPPRVRYGVACLLIRNTIGCVLLEWVGIGLRFRPGPHGARAAEVPRIYPGKHLHCKWGHGTTYLPKKP
jgi:hypothetical protein